METRHGNIDYNIEVDQHYYSVPYQLKGEKLQVRLTAHTLEALRKGQRVASHIRSFVPHQHTTLKEHMPAAHQKYSDWSPSRFVRWAHKIGPYTARLVQTIIDSRTHPEQAYRSCLGILRLEKHYPKERLETPPFGHFASPISRSKLCAKYWKTGSTA